MSDLREALKFAREAIWSGGDSISALAKIDAALAQPQNDQEADKNLEDAVTSTIFLSLADKDVVKATDCRLVAKRLLSEVIAPPPSSRMREALDEDPLADQLLGRASFLRDRGEIKSPELMEKAAQALRAGDNHASDTPTIHAINGPFASPLTDWKQDQAETTRIEPHAGDGWTSVTVPAAGIAKLMDAVENPREPNEALKKLMRNNKESEGGTTLCCVCDSVIRRFSKNCSVCGVEQASDDLGAPLERIRTEAASMGYALVPNDPEAFSNLQRVRRTMQASRTTKRPMMVWSDDLSAVDGALKALRGGE